MAFEDRFTVIDSLEDSRVAPYMNLRERTLRGESLFIAEGALVVERLLCSRFQVESILLTHKENGTAESVLALASPNVPVYYLKDRQSINRLVGFQFHQGVLAVGRRASLPTLTEGMANYFSGVERRDLDSNLSVVERDARSQRRAWVVLPDATKPDNLGLAFRCAAALDAEAVILGSQCCDPFSRRALRVSMGGVLQTPIYCANDLCEEMATVRREWGVRFYATTLDRDSHPLTEYNAQRLTSERHVAFVFGNEYFGLTPEVVAACDAKLIIPMRSDVDSLNLGVSVGIFLYEFNRCP
ncbi:MAG: RNA methyltransferase [Planctomycetia bacterium]|nr:RNA methyltransferase [Planctomycetia bacterium]